MLKHIMLFSSVVLAVLLTACGGGGGSSSDNSISSANNSSSLAESSSSEASSSSSLDSNNANIEGTFIDTLVYGLEYRTNGQTRQTTDIAKYTCVLGSNIDFYVGNIYLGSTTCDYWTTPYSLQTTNNEAAINIMQLLQTLDEDANLENGIKISEKLIKPLNAATFTIDDKEFDTKFATLTSQELVSEEDAIAHINESIATFGTQMSATYKSFDYFRFLATAEQNSNINVKKMLDSSDYDFQNGYVPLDDLGLAKCDEPLEYTTSCPSGYTTFMTNLSDSSDPMYVAIKKYVENHPAPETFCQQVDANGERIGTPLTLFKIDWQKESDNSVTRKDEYYGIYRINGNYESHLRTENILYPESTIIKSYRYNGSENLLIQSTQHNTDSSSQQYAYYCGRGSCTVNYEHRISGGYCEDLPKEKTFFDTDGSVETTNYLYRLSNDGFIDTIMYKNIRVHEFSEEESQTRRETVISFYHVPFIDIHENYLSMDTEVQYYWYCGSSNMQQWRTSFYDPFTNLKTEENTDSALCTN